MKPELGIKLGSETKPEELDELGSVVEVQLVRNALDRGMPAVVLLVEINGEVHRVVTTLRLFRMANLALCARMASELGEHWYFEPGELDGARC